MKSTNSTPGKRGPARQSDKQKAKARETMLAMRKKNPAKFDPKKNGATEAFKKRSAERKVIREAQKPPELKIDVEEVRKPTAATVPAPAPAPKVSPAPEFQQGPKIIELPQSELFSPASAAQPAAPAPEQKPPEQAQHNEQAGAGPQQAPGPGPAPAPEPPKNDPGVNRALAMMVWGMILNMLVLVFGEGMLPQKFKTPAGEIDENENILLAWCEYLNSLGFTKLSPLMNLILTIAGYFLLRMNLILTWFKNRRARKNPNSPESAPLRSAATPEPAPEPQKETPQPARPPSPTPEPEPGEEQLETEGGFR